MFQNNIAIAASSKGPAKRVQNPLLFDFELTRLLLLLVRHSTTTTARRTSVLTTSTELPVVTKTAVGTDLLQTLEVITQLGLNVVRQDLRILASREVLLPIQEPCGNLEFLWRLENVDNTLQLIRVQLTSTVSCQYNSTLQMAFRRARVHMCFGEYR